MQHSESSPVETVAARSGTAPPTVLSAAPLSTQGALAPRWSRFVAFCCDRLVLGSTWAAVVLTSERRPLSVALALFALGLQTLLLARGGQSLGKRLLRLRVVDVETGEAAGFARTVLVREVMFFALSLVPVVNVGSVCNALTAFRRSRRCLHDEAAGTRVERLTREAQAELDGRYVVPFTRRASAGAAPGVPRWLAPAYALPLLAALAIALELPVASDQLSDMLARAVARLEEPAPETAAPPPSPPPPQDFATRRAGFQTRLVHAGPAPQPWQDEPLPEGVRRVTYPSNSLGLAGFLMAPRDSTGPKPVLVYLHGGFAFGLSDLADCQPFSDAGFVVFAPTYRGENGNPGNFELLLGEVDDARAAVAWVARQPFTDSQRIYVFGHSIGGGVAELMTLFPGDPIALSGSSGGLYGSLEGLLDELPFDPNRPVEKELRTLWGNLASVRRRHVAYLGTEERPIEPYRRAIESELEGHDALLEVRAVAGDHFTSLQPAMLDFLSEISKQRSAR